MKEVRYATLEDREEIYKLMVELEEHDIDKIEFDKCFESNLKNKNIHYIVCQESETILGFASVHFQQLLHHTSMIAELQEIIVTHSARRNGVGEMLLNEVKALSKRFGCKQLEVCCNQKRIHSHKFYEVQGMSCSHFKFCEKL